MLKSGLTKSGLRIHRWTAFALLLTLFACGGGDTRREEPVAQVEQADTNPDPNVPPSMPQPLALPQSPIVPGAQVGYLPASWSVSSSGQFTYTIPLDVPQGRAGMQPKLSLNYSSDGGNGILGVGWSVSGLSSITRCGKNLSSEGTVDGVDYSDFTTDQEESVDHFCLDGQKLVAISGRYGAYGTEYRTEHDIYAQIFSEGSVPTAKLGPTSFTVKTHDGQIRVYNSVNSPRWHVCTHGLPCAGSMVSEDKAPSRWLLASETDRNGNSVVYTYTTVDDGSGGQETLPSKIDYTKHTSDSSSYRYVQFNYENRQDRSFTWQSGVRISQSKRLESIVMHAPNPATTMPVWMYRFQYTTDADKGPAIADPSLLASVQKCGIFNEGNAAIPGGCLWKKKFDWYNESLPSFTTNDIDQTDIYTGQGINIIQPVNTHPVVQALDVDGDGADDILFQPGDEFGTQTATGQYKPNPKALLFRSRVVAPPPLGSPFTLLGYKNHVDSNGSTFASDVDLATIFPLDLDGDGTDEAILTRNINGLDTCQSNLVHWDTNTFADVTSWPTYSCSEPRFHRFLDLDGDGRLDHIQASSHWESHPDLPGNPSTQWFGPWQASLNLGGMFGPTVAAGAGDLPNNVTVIVDRDGDGRAEAWRANDFPNFWDRGDYLRMLDANAGWGPDSNALPEPDFPGSDVGSYDNLIPIVYGDFNGDGLDDAFHVRWTDWSVGGQPNCAWIIRWNIGKGYAPESVTSGPFNAGCGQQNGFVGRHYQSFRVADLNRDGRDDIVAFDASQGVPQVILMLSKYMPGRPDGFGFDVHTLSGHTPLWLEWLTSAGDTFPTSKLGDFNGDGFVDISGVELPGPNSPVTNPTLVVLTQTPQFANRLKSVTDDGTYWARETITYSTDLSDKPEDREACAYPLHCVTRGSIVVREVASRDHLVDPIDPNQNVRTQYYSYEDPVNDMRGRGFQGFRKVRVWDPSRPMETVTTYDNHKQWPKTYYPFAMRPTEVTKVVPLTALEGWPRRTGFDALDARVMRTTYTDQLKLLNGGKSYDDLPDTWSSREWEQKVGIDWGTIDPAPANPTSEHIFGIVEPDKPLRSVKGYAKFDDYGNLNERETSVSSTTDPGTSRLEVAHFDNLTNDWLLGLKRWDTVTVNEPNNVDQPSVTRSMDYDYDVVTGHLKTIYQEKNNADPSLRGTTTLTYDPTYGLVTSVVTQATDSSGAITSREIRHEYQPVWPNQPNEHVFLSQIWRPYSPLEYRPSAWVAFHPAYGVVEATMDMNGVQTSSVYDDLGREVYTQQSGQSPKQTSYLSRVDNFGGFNGVEISRTVDGAEASSFKDALGREIQASENKFDGSFAVVDTTYDILGRVAMRSRPHASQAVSTKSFFDYDPLGRLLKTTLPNSATIVSVHSFSQTQTTDADQHQSTVVRDVANRLITSSNMIAGASVSTSYRYAPSGKVDRVTDAMGNKTQTRYDILGRAIHQQDPDVGVTDLTYDGFGELIIEKHQGSGETTAYQYDALGRLYDTLDPDGAHTKFTWDSAVNGIGQIAGTHSPDNVDTTNTYDAAGRPVASVQTLGGQSYKSEVKYDPQGHISELLYPSIDSSNLPALTLQYKYTPANYLYEIGYVAPGQAYQMLEHVTARNLDDALLKGEYGSTLNTTRTYEPETGRLSTEVVATGMNNSLFDLSYTYYASGLVWTRTDAAVNRLETFTFDGAARLSDWKNQYAGNSINTHYSYDPTGNLTDVTNGIGYTEHNDYGSAGNTFPHALTKQTFTGGATASYGYDTYGRQNSASGYGHDVSHGGTRAIPKYTRFDLPHTLTMNGNASTLLYNALGDRVRKVTPAGTTTYVGKLYEFREESGQPQHVFHVYGPEGALADITQVTAVSPKVVTFLANDALGSVGATITSGGAVSQWAYFEPFGKRIKPDGSEFDISTVGALKKGFTGHEHDYEFGLINMRGRMYDPAIRRFLTPDPIVSNPLFGQSWNPYSYVNNSPLNATDPTGYTVCIYEGTEPPPGCGANDKSKSSAGTYTPVPNTPGDWAVMGGAGVFTGGAIPGWGTPGAGTGSPASAGPARSDGTEYVSPAGENSQPTGAGTDDGGSWKDSDFVQGFGGFLGGLGLGLTPFGGFGHGVGTATGIIGPGSRAQQLGLGLGEMVGGIAEIVGGAGGAFGGTVLSGTGLGALIGVPAIVGSAMLVTSGAGNVTGGIADIGQALMSKGSGRGRFKSGEDDLDQSRDIEDHKQRLKAGHKAEDGEKVKDAINSTRKSDQRVKNRLDRTKNRSDWPTDDLEGVDE